MSNSKSHLISEGAVVITGKDSKGQVLTVEAPIKDLEIKVEQDWDRIYTNTYSSSANIFKTGSETTFIMKVGGNGRYTVKTKSAPKGVERTARVEILREDENAKKKGLTSDAIAQAAFKAGVSVDTPFRIVTETETRTLARVTYAEFYWTT